MLLRNRHTLAMRWVRQWPRSAWKQDGIALVCATILAMAGCHWTAEAELRYYVRAYPHDGQDGLGAMMDGLTAAFWIELAGFAVIFWLQRTFMPRGKAD